MQDKGRGRLLAPSAPLRNDGYSPSSFHAGFYLPSSSFRPDVYPSSSSFHPDFYPRTASFHPDIYRPSSSFNPDVYPPSSFRPDYLPYATTTTRFTPPHVSFAPAPRPPTEHPHLRLPKTTGATLLMGRLQRIEGELAKLRSLHPRVKPAASEAPPPFRKFCCSCGAPLLVRGSFCMACGEVRGACSTSLLTHFSPETS